MTRNRIISLLLTGALCAGGPVATSASDVTTAASEMVVIEAGRDATLIQDPDGGRANGSGPFLFAGRTSQNQNAVRRGLLWFDVAGEVPADAVIEDVTLVLTVVAGNSPVVPVRAHRVLADWGEGASAASGGGGAPAEPGDATWLHTFHDDRFWAISGGQFVGRESGSQLVARDGVYVWEDQPGLLRDVRIWLAAPHRNFGWVLIGDETARQTAKRFASRENPDPTIRPVLEITFRRR